MARKKARARKSIFALSSNGQPSFIIQLGIVFIIVAAMFMAMYVGGIYWKQ